MKPFLKWAGGKRWFVSQQSHLLPPDYNRYIEPFLGSAAVFFHLQPNNSLLSDTNQELINTYCAIRDYPELVFRYLKKHQKHHSKEYYYWIRGKSFLSTAKRASCFIYLNRTCWNGLYRVNLKGVFNVPKGTKDSVVFDDDDFFRISRTLQKARLYSQDFEEILESANEGDLVYVDPPYTVKHNNNNFLKYNERIFTWRDQERLAASLDGVARRGARVLISNANHQCIRELYSSSSWVYFDIARHSILASNSMHRRQTSELMISNFLDELGNPADPR